MIYIEYSVYPYYSENNRTENRDDRRRQLMSQSSESCTAYLIRTCKYFKQHYNSHSQEGVFCHLGAVGEKAYEQITACYENNARYAAD